MCIKYFYAFPPFKIYQSEHRVSSTVEFWATRRAQKCFQWNVSQLAVAWRKWFYIYYFYTFCYLPPPRVPWRRRFSFIVNRCNDFSGRLYDRVRTCPRWHCQLGPWRQLTRSLFRLCLPDLADSILSLFGWHLAYLQEYKEKCTWVSGEK